MKLTAAPEKTTRYALWNGYIQYNTCYKHVQHMEPQLWRFPHWFLRIPVRNLCSQFRRFTGPRPGPISKIFCGCSLTFQGSVCSCWQSAWGLSADSSILQWKIRGDGWTSVNPAERWHNITPCKFHAGLTLYVLNFAEGTQTYIYILCHYSTLIWHMYLKSFLK